MNQEEISEIVSKALNRSCACEEELHGTTCPQGGYWHTWRQRRQGDLFYERLAAVFVGTDRGSHKGFFRVNYLNQDVAQSIVASAKTKNIPGVEICSDHNSRVAFDTRCYKKELSSEILSFYTQSITKALGENQN